MRAALTFVTLLFVVAAGCVIAGVALLAGYPWALIAGGGCLFVAAYILRAGLTQNG